MRTATSTALHTTSFSRSVPGPYIRPATVNNWFDNLLLKMDLWQQRIVQRKQLRLLDEHLLKDIGLSRQEAIVESRKPFWKA